MFMDESGSHRQRLSQIGLLFFIALLQACGGGGGNASDLSDPPENSASTETDVANCIGQCADTPTRLEINDVQRVLAQAVNEAQAHNVLATIAVSDRVGNILAVLRMNGANRNRIVSPDAVENTGSHRAIVSSSTDNPLVVNGFTITNTSSGVDATRVSAGRSMPVVGGLENLAVVPDTLAAIAKALTGAYLSSEGNAFSSRTANQIVQEHFNPGEFGQPGGPLFGVQFSQLPCSDFNQRFNPDGDDPRGPKRSPLGLSADPGGFPLYKNGTVVGGIGVIADGLYGLDSNLNDIDQDIDELIALAGAVGFLPPIDRQADRITVEGKTLRFSDAQLADLMSSSDSANYASLIAQDGINLTDVPGYFSMALGIRRGTAFGHADSGIVPDNTGLYAGLDAFVLVDNAGNNRFPPRGSDEANGLTAQEVQSLLQEALGIANKTRAQIRRPTGTTARVSISIVDTNGDILGIARTRDAPIFGLDVSLQKARSAMFFSRRDAGGKLSNLSPRPALTPLAGLAGTSNVGGYVRSLRNSFGESALADGVAYSNRAVGNIARPYFPDGILGTPAGPLSRPFAVWSPFAVGLQLDLVAGRVVRPEGALDTIVGGIAQHVLFVAGVVPDVEPSCVEPSISEIRNGIQIFSGSVPIYRGNTLIGGIGVSGDGIDQDIMIAFLALDAVSQTQGAPNNAPHDIRIDNQVSAEGVRLRYINCPQAPFIDSNEQNVCAGK